MRRLVPHLLLAALAAASLAAAPAEDASPPELRSFIPTWRHAEQDVHVSAFADDTRRGGSAIAGVTVTVQGVAYEPAALDGAYDTSSEEVDTLLGATVETGGLVEVCGWATDAAGNSGDPVCDLVQTDDVAAPYTVSRPRTTPAAPDLGEEITLHATLEDQWSDVAAVAYSLDGGALVSMAPTDGAFDEPREGASAAVGTLPAGVHRLCVYGTDEHGNTGGASATPIDGSAPRECVDVHVRDRRAPVVTDISQTPAPAAFGEAVTLLVTADDRDRGGSAVDHAEVEVDGTPLATSFTAAEEGPLATIPVRLDPFAEAGEHEVCVRVRDAAGNTSERTCATIEVTDRVALGTITTASLARPEANVGPSATFSVDATQAADGTVTGGFTYSEPAIAFTADLPTTAVFEQRDLDHRLHATGTGLLHGAVVCQYELTVLDHEGQDDPTDALFLTVTCNGVPLVDGGELARAGDIHVRA